MECVWTRWFVFGSTTTTQTSTACVYMAQSQTYSSCGRRFDRTRARTCKHAKAPVRGHTQYQPHSDVGVCTRARSVCIQWLFHTRSLLLIDCVGTRQNNRIVREYTRRSTIIFAVDTIHVIRRRMFTVMPRYANMSILASPFRFLRCVSFFLRLLHIWLLPYGYYCIILDYALHARMHTA